MKIVVAGLTPRDEMAFGIFLERSMKTWSWERAAVVRGARLPLTDLVVLDLAGAGLAKGSLSAQAELSTLLGDMPAVLLVSAHNISWSALQIETEPKSPWVWLSKPYGTEDMRLALQQAFSLRTQSAQVQPAQAPLATPLPSLPPAAVSAANVDKEVGMNAAEFQSKLAQLPAGKDHLFLNNFAGMLSRQQTFEVRFTVQNSVIVHAANGWVASNTPLQVIRQVCQSDNLASAVAMRDIDPDDAEERVHLLGMHPSELDLFLGELMDAALWEESSNLGIAKPN